MTENTDPNTGTLRGAPTWDDGGEVLDCLVQGAHAAAAGVLRVPVGVCAVGCRVRPRLLHKPRVRYGGSGPALLRVSVLRMVVRRVGSRPCLAVSARTVVGTTTGVRAIAGPGRWPDRTSCGLLGLGRLRGLVVALCVLLLAPVLQ